jgi:hypothetical protein
MRPALTTASGCIAHTQCTLPPAEQCTPNAACSILFRVRTRFSQAPLHSICDMDVNLIFLLPNLGQGCAAKNEAARQHSEHDEQRPGLLSKEKNCSRAQQLLTQHRNLRSVNRRWWNRRNGGLAVARQISQDWCNCRNRCIRQHRFNRCNRPRGSVPAGLRGRTVGR